MTRRAWRSVADATLPTALAISSLERSDSAEAEDTSREVWEISSAVDWIVSTSVATWPMPVRRIAAGPSASPAATLRSRRSSASARADELRALDGVVGAQLGHGQRLALHRAGEDDQARCDSKTTKTACRRTMPRPRWPCGITHTGAPALWSTMKPRWWTAIAPAAITITRQSR